MILAFKAFLIKRLVAIQGVTGRHIDPQQKKGIPGRNALF
jgi:hypothetical protein